MYCLVVMGLPLTVTPSTLESSCSIALRMRFTTVFAGMIVKELQMVDDLFVEIELS